MTVGTDENNAHGGIVEQPADFVISMFHIVFELVGGGQAGDYDTAHFYILVFAAALLEDESFVYIVVCGCKMETSVPEVATLCR